MITYMQMFMSIMLCHCMLYMLVNSIFLIVFVPPVNRRKICCPNWPFWPSEFYFKKTLLKKTCLSRHSCICHTYSKVRL